MSRELKFSGALDTATILNFCTVPLDQPLPPLLYLDTQAEGPSTKMMVKLLFSTLSIQHCPHSLMSWLGPATDAEGDKWEIARTIGKRHARRNQQIRPNLVTSCTRKGFVRRYGVKAILLGSISLADLH